MAQMNAERCAFCACCRGCSLLSQVRGRETRLQRSCAQPLRHQQCARMLSKARTRLRRTGDWAIVHTLIINH